MALRPRIPVVEVGLVDVDEGVAGRAPAEVLQVRLRGQRHLGRGSVGGLGHHRVSNTDSEGMRHITAIQGCSRLFTSCLVVTQPGLSVLLAGR